MNDENDNVEGDTLECKADYGCSDEVVKALDEKSSCTFICIIAANREIGIQVIVELRQRVLGWIGNTS